MYIRTRQLLYWCGIKFRMDSSVRWLLLSACSLVLSVYISETTTVVNTHIPESSASATPPIKFTGSTTANNQGFVAGFYDYECNADTYDISLTSFSSIWALINVLLVIVASVLYMIYMCFSRFVNTMIYP